MSLGKEQVREKKVHCKSGEEGQVKSDKKEASQGGRDKSDKKGQVREEKTSQIKRGKSGRKGQVTSEGTS